jgi:hypothetical protein
MAKTRFMARLRPSGRGAGGHLVEVPDDVVAALGGKGRIPVQASFNGVPYRGSIVRMGGVMMLGVTKRSWPRQEPDKAMSSMSCSKTTRPLARSRFHRS